MSTLDDTVALAKFQADFCTYLRAPTQRLTGELPAGTSQRGMQTYRELVFAKVESFLLACFPMTRQRLGARAWRKLTRQFVLLHAAQSPYFRDIPAEFVAWLHHTETDANFPWLSALAHWEWLELVVAIADSTQTAAAPRRQLCLAQGEFVLNPSMRLAQYAWAVHQIAPKHAIAAEATWLLAYRELRPTSASQDKVQFMELNAASFALLQGILDGWELMQWLATLAAQWQYDLAALTIYAETFLCDLQQRGVLLPISDLPN